MAEKTVQETKPSTELVDLRSQVETLMTEFSNIPDSVLAKLGKNLHNMPRHPIQICKNLIYEYFKTIDYDDFTVHDDVSPIVDTESNFDSLLIPKDHPARRTSDTYYLSEGTVLRTHTSAHQSHHLKSGETNFLCTGDVYRKDAVDATHYYVFHQMEGMAKVDDDVDPFEELKKVMVGLTRHLFPDNEYRINPDYFPFTDPSFEVEVKVMWPNKKGELEERWLEILGCGVTREEIITNSGREGRWWAFGLGLERICMVLFGINDIRQFWDLNERFLSQYEDNKIHAFVPYSQLPDCSRDISFWINSGLKENVMGNDGVEELWWSRENDLFELIRSIFGEWIKSVTLHDKFTNKKGRHSRCYRLNIVPIDSSITDPGQYRSACTDMMKELYTRVAEEYDVEIR